MAQALTDSTAVQTTEIQKTVSYHVNEWLTQAGVASDTASWLKTVVMIAAIILLSFLANWITKKIILGILNKIAKKTKTNWDDKLISRRVFHKLAHLAPALVVYLLAPVALLEYNELFYQVVQSAAKIYMVLVVLLSIDAFINAGHDIYQSYEIAKTKPIKGYLQVVKILIYLVAAILILSIFIGKSPWFLLGGLGAFAAVLMLVFKDSILGFTGSIQLSANDMVRPGDWISMPDFGADGTVIEMNLTTVKVQNWDKTISTVPTYSLITNSFKNWRGMEESGGRRIMRNIIIDINSIKFCSNEMIEKFKKFRLINEYVVNKEKELEEYNAKHNLDNSIVVNGRRQTNIGIFQEYLRRYLKENENIREDMTFLVRQLQPTELGLPIQIYVFSKIQAWVDYEKIQADIFDHALAVLPQFELLAFQNPSGRDFAKVFTADNSSTKELLNNQSQ